MAWFRRKPKAGQIHHSDRGSQCAGYDYQDVLKGYGMTPSMSCMGNCWDNAVMESFFNSLKNERVHHARYQTGEAARQDILDYINGLV